jgi:hypothetical protein
MFWYTRPLIWCAWGQVLSQDGPAGAGFLRDKHAMFWDTIQSIRVFVELRFFKVAVLGAFAKSWKLPFNFVISVRLSACISAVLAERTGFREIWYCGLYGNLSRKSKFGYNRAVYAKTWVRMLLPATLNLPSNAVFDWNCIRLLVQTR